MAEFRVIQRAEDEEEEQTQTDGLPPGHVLDKTIRDGEYE